MFLGIEIGGTKVQLGLGEGDGALLGLWRGPVDVKAGPEGIRRQILGAVPELLDEGHVSRSELRGIGIGFGGPVDDRNKTIIKSHQIAGWDHFPLANWIGEMLGLPTALGNDADVAGLAEAWFGAGTGLSPIFYITIGSGIGGGLVIDGNIYRGCGRGAAEIGHLRFWSKVAEASSENWWVEKIASGWGIADYAREQVSKLENQDSLLVRMAKPEQITTRHVGEAAMRGDRLAQAIMGRAVNALGQAISQVAILLCPRRFIIGGGVSLADDEVFLKPLQIAVLRQVAAQFPPFSHCFDIVPAALGEEVVVHGALALARRTLTEPK